MLYFLAIAVVVAVSYGAHALFEWTGWEFALGFGAGYLFFIAAFRIHYGWWPDWNADGQDEENQRLPRLTRR
jgi:hypothetical protein